MPSRPWKQIGFAALCFPVILAAQSPIAAPTFEVVSIRVVPPNTPPVNRDWDFTPILPGGQFVDSRTNLLSMIAWAYNMKNVNLSVQLVSLPNWAKDQSYAVAAKPAEDFPALSSRENQDQVRLMLRAMLADRFRLKLHTETRQERGYKLEQSKGGIRIKEVAPPEPPAKANPVGAAMRNDGGVHIVAKKSTMASLASALNQLTQRPVVDETGLKGYYDFDVRWSGPEARDGQATESEFGGPELVGLLISNLQTHFGLRLTSITGPVEYWVVDHVEPPTSN
jgi:uncharacterized protein (TIGR03435 family)